VNFHDLAALFSAPWRKKFEGDAGEWSNGKLLLPTSTRQPTFTFRYTPHFREIFAALNNKKKKRVHVMGPAGSGKSMIGIIDLCFSVWNDPGFYYYVWPSDEDGKDQVEDQIVPILEANDFLAELMPQDRQKRRAMKIIFSEMIFHTVGANESSAQRVRAYKLRMEEPHLFKPGFLAKFRKRMVGVKQATEATFSTGSVLEDESDVAWKESSMAECAVLCPACQTYHVPKDNCLKWDKNETTWDEATHEYRWDELRKTVRYECPNCSVALPQKWNAAEDIDEARLELIQNYRWESQNPNASGEIEGFHSNFYFVPWLNLQDVAMEKIRATHAAHRGQLEMLKDYVQKTLAEAWDEAPRDTDRSTVASGYLMLEAWPEEISRMLSVDVQKDHFWAVCRAYGTEGKSRLIWAGRLETYEQIEEKRLELGVEPRRTGIDMQFDTNVVHQNCLKYGWLAFSAMDAVSFPKIRPNMKPLHLPYSEPKRGHVGIGMGGVQRTVIYFLWSNPTIKDLWHNMKNSAESGYTVADDVGPVYLAQTSAEYKRQETTKGGAKVWRYHVPQHKDDHLGSAEQINLVMACMDMKLAIGKNNLVLESVESSFGKHLTQVKK
jgi:hypothetical protein